MTQPSSPAAAARAILDVVAQRSTLIRWRSLQGLKIDIATSDEVGPIQGGEGARLRIDGVFGLDGTDGVCDLSLVRREHAEGEALWFVMFGNIYPGMEPVVYAGNPAMPSAHGIRDFMDSDDVVAMNTRCDPEWEAFKVLRSLDIALRAAGYDESFDGDDVARLEAGGGSAADMADWIEDLGNRMGCDTRDFQSRIDVYLRAARGFDSQADVGGEWLAQVEG